PVPVQKETFFVDSILVNFLLQIFQHPSGCQFDNIEVYTVPAVAALHAIFFLNLQNDLVIPVLFPIKEKFQNPELNRTSLAHSLTSHGFKSTCIFSKHDETPCDTEQTT